MKASTRFILWLADGIVYTAVLCALSGFAQPAGIQPPAPKLGPRLPPPAQMIVITNLVVSWDPYTNAYFEVMGKTNLTGTNWYHITNASMAATSVVLRATKPQEFFKVETRYNP